MSQQVNISLPAPTITSVSQPFWDGIKEGRLMLQQCDQCSEWIFYPRAHCPHCFHCSLTWKEAAGAGILKTWSIIHRAGHPAWQEHTPYVVGVVQLTEGPSLLTHLNVNEDELNYQMEVEMDIQNTGPHPLPFFKPIKEETI
ncbi:Zn-ribbon domain-containing OB-fold protein [Halobacillus sp. A5]|uniref:Zn-ribbon domain-containing OB-fold protein n=1 Tax=Halobacillus sp. A5 TaxID=2880263 RepID=UPI0020A66A87|nr:OB-fold domain-containing protein [Halobacillus sp. A5]MCP3028570.1 zinc ribbon domain-containing protein [Halobacillus sp. A5]